MTKKSEDPLDPFSNARRRAEQARLSAQERAAFEAKMAKERAAFEARMTAERALFETRMTEARTRADALGSFRERRLVEIAAMMAVRRNEKPPFPNSFRKRKPPPDEGGEPVPAVPRPRPKPLAGGAAAPLDPDRRKPADGTPRKGARRVRLPSEADSRLSL